MNQTLNRREMLRRTAVGLTSFFCVGRLQFDAAGASEGDDLRLAAATSFEFMIQKVFIPYGMAAGLLQVSPEVREKALDVSKWLNPSNAPGIFRDTVVVPGQNELVVRFSDTVAVALSQRSIDQLRACLFNLPNPPFGVLNLNDQAVVEYIVESFSFKENWRFD